MNFIVNYNMLESPSELAEIKKQENRRNNIDQDTVNQLQNSVQLLKQSICAPTNREISKVDKLFPSYSVALNML